MTVCCSGWIVFDDCLLSWLDCFRGLSVVLVGLFLMTVCCPGWIVLDDCLLFWLDCFR